MRYMFFLLVLITSCVPPNEHYILDDIPQDSMNLITDDKVVLGEYMMGNEMISVDGRTKCTNCHIPEKAFTAFSLEPSGGCGEGCVLLPSGAVVVDLNFKGKRDSMSHIKSPSIIGVAWRENLGWSARFGYGGANKDIVETISKHFKVSDVLAEMLLDCGPTIFQACIALNGHALLLRRRLLSDPVGLSLIESSYGLRVTETTDSDSIIFAIACSLDAFQRVQSPSNSPFQRYVEGDMFAMSETQLLGYSIMKRDCAGCHSSPLWGGGIELGHAQFNGKFKPDHREELDGIPREGYYRNTAALRTNMKDHNCYGFNCQYETLEDFLEDNFKYTQPEVDAISDFILNGMYDDSLY